MKQHYCNLKIEEGTRKTIKELAARSGLSMKDFIKKAFDIKEDWNEKKKIKFDFKL